MENERQSLGQSPSAEILQDISHTLMGAWPTVRKKLVTINELQSAACMPVSHIQLLCMLCQEGALSVTQISERFGIAKPNITPMVDRLISDGLVARVRNSQDKRIVSVVVCDKGREKLLDVQRNLCRILTEWTDKLDAAQVCELRDALKTIVDLIHK